MFTTIARLILRNRTAFLVALLVGTSFMLYQASRVEFSYKFSRILPTTDSTQIAYVNFQKTFDQAGNTIVLAAQNFDVFDKKGFSLWHQFEMDLENMDGISNVLSPSKAFNISRNDSIQKLEIETFPKHYDNLDLDSLGSAFYKLPFYKGLLYGVKSKTPILLIQIEKNILYEKEVQRLVERIKTRIKAFEKESGTNIRASGLPYIRLANSKKTSNEIFMFIGLSLTITTLLLFFFLRSFKATFISLLVVILGVIWSLGLIVSFGFSITMLTALVPSLIIVIGVPNCIFLINKYHTEYKEHGNQILSVQRVIRRIGAATLLTNTTTALGFGALILTESVILREFGIIASINILVVFLISIILIPIFYSFSKPPKRRHYKHLEKRWVEGFIRLLKKLVETKRKWVYGFTVLLALIALYGTTKMYATGNITEEFQEHDPLKKDLKYFEDNFGGVVPLEIIIDTRKKNGYQKLSNLKRIDKLQKELGKIPEVSRSLSIVDPFKYVKQAYYRGDSSFYSLPTSQEKNFIFSYIPEAGDKESFLNTLVDSTGSKIRITAQIKDLATEESKIVLGKIREVVDSIFDPKRYDVVITGASVVFVKGTSYLIKNLILSLVIAIVVIAFIMALLFRSFAMVFVSLLPNLFPLLITAGLMGYFGIPLKPSTILVFSIAFGISVDDTIHFLAKYRLELRHSNWNIRQSILVAINETGISMFYTSIVLFFGFSIFIASSFGGIVSLGILVSLTLIIAMVSNLVLLPSMLMSLEKLVANKEFNNPFIRIYKDKGEEEEDDEDENEDKS